jgi:hypothetical protein
MRLISGVLRGLGIVHASLGFKREAAALFILLLPFVFHEQVRTYLAAHGVGDWPVVDGIMPAIVLAGAYLYWRLLRHAVLFEYDTRPSVTARILDPSQRYETYVALGNRVLRLYHLEVENPSRFRTARRVSVTLMGYQRTGDAKMVDIRSRLKVANSDAEELDLNPRGRVAFELCAVEVENADSAAPEERVEQTFSILPVGSGTIGVVAESYGAPSRDEQYRVYIDTTGAMTIKPQSEAH